MNVPLIQVNHLKKYFKTSRGYLHAVDNVNMQMHLKMTLTLRENIQNTRMIRLD